ncbi:hypothetical protein EDB86DRAFT_2962991 [Lactarius hatsudake]|nr:hypothetical protein EDB86DRAFT_2962991 [Lactarius hatsudake]
MTASRSRARPRTTVRVREGKRTTHDGIEVEFVGNIELFYDRGHHQEFFSLSQEVVTCDRRRRSTLCSRMLRSSTRATWASMSSCGS